MTIKISGSLVEKEESLIKKGGGSLNFVLKEMMPPFGKGRGFFVFLPEFFEC